MNGIAEAIQKDLEASYRHVRGFLIKQSKF